MKKLLELCECIKSLSVELENEIAQRYGDIKNNPDLVKKYQTDMRTIIKANNLLNSLQPISQRISNEDAEK